MPDNLSAKIKADASDYVSSVELAADRTDALGDQANQASGRVERLGDKSTTTATSVGALGATVTSTSAAVSTLSLATSASLVPALGALSTTAVPLTATLGGLATAAGGVATGFGAVIGTGIFAYGEDLKEQNEKRLAQLKEKRDTLISVREQTGELTDAQQNQLNKLNEQIEATKETTSVTGALSAELEPAKEQFRESALALGEEFIPLIRDAIDALPAFIRRIEESIGDLTPFAEALRDAGQAAFDTVPKMVEQMMDMGRDALPAVRDLGSYLDDNIIPIMEGMADTTDRVIDIMPDLSGGFLNAVGAANELGTTILETVTPALTAVGDKAITVAEGFNNLTSSQQETAAKAALVAPALGTVATRLAGINPVLGGVAAAVGGLGFAWTENIDNIRTKTNDLVSDMTKYDDVQAALSSTADSAVSAFDDIVSATQDVISENETIQTSLDEVTSAVGTAADGIQGLADGEWSSGFDSLESAAADAVDGYRVAIVGDDGDGGLAGHAETAVEDAQTYLQNEAPTAITEGSEALVNAAADALDELSTILIGPDGTSGVLSDMVDAGERFMSETAPVLLGASAEAIGSAIRAGLVDFTNPLKGKDSEFWDMIVDGANFAATNGPDAMVAAGKGIVEGVIEGAAGLTKGLTGSDPSSLFSQIQSAAGELSNTVVSEVTAIGSGIIEGITNGISNAAESLKDAILSPINTAINVTNDALPGDINIPQIGPFGGASFSTGAAGKVPGVPNKVKVPQMGPFGGGEVNISGIPIPKVNTGGFIEESGLANVHEGERVIPKAQVSDRGPVETGPKTEIVIEELHASGRREGQQAARGLKREMRRQGVGR